VSDVPSDRRTNGDGAHRAAGTAVDVVVVGAGPCGVILANLLGLYGVRTVVLERDTEPPSYPRAVGIDDESLRTCQTVGLVDELLADIIQNTPIRYYTSWGRCLAHVEPSVQPFGWPRRNLFLQPLLEATLRRGLQRFPTVELRLGVEVVGLTQDGDGVDVVARRAEGADQRIRARYVVGADGGRSTVRKLIGVDLVGRTAPARWLVVDVADDHLDAPYSAVHCHPRQPLLTMPLPYRHRRFELQLGPEDDEATVTDPGHVLAMLRSQYGAGPLPTVVRARVYLHHSRIAQRFQVGRVFLAGDAAHLQPPFFGQGMNSGFRDATNLAWKLAAVVSGRAAPAIVETYDIERRSHAATMVDFATRIGRMYRPRSTVTERLRDLVFRAVQAVPGGRDYILQMKYKPMPFYRDGIVVRHPSAGHGQDPVGRLFMQPTVEAAGRRRCRLDDVLGPWFAVVGVHTDPTAHLSPPELAWYRSLGARFVEVVPPRATAVPGRSAARAVTDDHVVVEDVLGAFRDWKLARPGQQVLVLRPDRYVAAVSDAVGFGATTVALRRRLDRHLGVGRAA
jgi:3-(3-hydroxy-phenyl)propionate hydroxylase